MVTVFVRQLIDGSRFYSCHRDIVYLDCRSDLIAYNRHEFYAVNTMGNVCYIFIDSRLEVG